MFSIDGDDLLLNEFFTSILGILKYEKIYITKASMNTPPIATGQSPISDDPIGLNRLFKEL